MKTQRIASQSTVVSIEKNPSVIEFVRRVSQVAGVRCVVAEPEDGAIHLTTFAHPLTEEVSDAVIAIEAHTIDSGPDFLFDFHLRDSADTLGGTPEAVRGERFVWGSLDENSRRAPQTSKG